MSNQTENRCYRCRTDCTPAANLAADVPGLNGMPASFVCVGWNRPTSRIVPADRFTLCWKNDEVAALRNCAEELVRDARRYRCALRHPEVFAQWSGEEAEAAIDSLLKEGM